MITRIPHPHHPQFISTLPLLISAALLGAAFPACASRAPVPPSPAAVPVAASVSPPESSPGPGQSDLGQSIQDNLTGLALETPADRERIEREATALANSHKGRGGSAIRRSRVQSCQKDEPKDAYEAVFCHLWLEASGLHHEHGPKHPLRLSSTWAGRKRLKALERAVTAGDLSALSQASESEIHETIKKAPAGMHLRPLIEAALDNHACTSSTLLTGLGLKSEESFPDPDYRELAEALYARSGECGTNAASAKGLYRLGLLQIWDQNYAAAAKTLAKLTDSPDAADYRSRVVYWIYFCAKQTGDVALRDKMKGLLGKEYHLTLHGLITVGPKPTDNHPNVIFVSATRPQFNATVRVAEALLEQDARHDAIAALEPIVDELTEAEPSFQLYVGLLLMRAGDSVHKFKLLTGLYRDYPGLISRDSLEMLFPLHRFEVVQHYGQKADPYLMISLMRQESAFNDRARSPVGALGLMQLMPKTARRMEHISRNALYDPNVNIRLGVRFFSRLNERYGGESDLALAAYNAGPENVDIWQTRYPVSNRLLFVDLIPFRETREYVASIARNYFWYKKLYEEERVPSSSASALPGGQPQQQEKFTFFKLFDS